MADELIRLDTTIIGIDSLINKASTVEEAKVLFTVKDTIYTQQRYVIDVQPMKRGKWETWGYVFHGIEWERCSVCGKTADISYIALLEGKIEPVTPSFCGCCGARMDLKGGDT